MFVQWGQLMVRARWSVLAATVVFVGFGASWGTGVFGGLSGGGLDDPTSASAMTRQEVIDVFGRRTWTSSCCTPAPATRPTTQRS
jgi:trehalose monomycolate/heme transporter